MRTGEGAAVAFWLLVGSGYLLLLSAGFALGHLLSARRRPPGRGGTTRPIGPPPCGPSFAIHCPPLGSAFDRALLPGAFDGEQLPEAV